VSGLVAPELVPQVRAHMREENRRQPIKMTRLPLDALSVATMTAEPVEIWRSRRFLAVVYFDDGHYRLTVNRTMLAGDGRWEDGITWDELMTVKHEVGFGDRWCAEIYPPDDQAVDDANMRHLWLLDEAPDFGWKRAVA